MTNFEKMLDESIESFLAKKAKGALKSRLTKKGRLNRAKNKAAKKKDKQDTKTQLKQMKKKKKEKKKKVNEASYKELEELGYCGGVRKRDGTGPHLYGKNYNRGYWQKRLEQAKEAGDKIGMRYAKMELEKCKIKPKEKKLEETIHE